VTHAEGYRVRGPLALLDARALLGGARTDDTVAARTHAGGARG
jgi:hypothetical protein